MADNEKSKKKNGAKKAAKTNAVKSNENKKVQQPKREKKDRIEKEENIKQARKQLYYTENNSSSDELSKLIKIILIVTGIIIVFYGVTAIITEKAKETSDKSEPVDIQYDSIVIGSMLNINGSYYVLIEEADDVRLNEYTTLIQTIQANEDAPKIYTADLNSSFNRGYLSNKTNYDSNMETFRVKGTTLVKVSDHKIVSVYDNYDAIANKLNELD